MRYEGNQSVSHVLSWLASQNCVVTSRAYQYFHLRVLRLMSLDQAEKLGVDVDLLRAIRTRLKIPVDPRRVGSTLAKPIKRFDLRHRQRRIQIGPEVKRPVVVPPPKSPRRGATESDSMQLAPAGLVPAEAADEYVFRGDPEKLATLSRQDWVHVNKEARRKLLKISRHVWPNQNGTVFHLHTRKEYTREELAKDFGLTAAEAESCYQTF